jgi:hypothetical protein
MNSTSVNLIFSNKTLDELKEACYNLSKEAGKGLSINVNVINNGEKRDITVGIMFKIKDFQ